jgi:hypothetical protein
LQGVILDKTPYLSTEFLLSGAVDCLTNTYQVFKLNRHYQLLRLRAGFIN